MAVIREGMEAAHGRRLRRARVPRDRRGDRRRRTRCAAWRSPRRCARAPSTSSARARSSTPPTTRTWSPGRSARARSARRRCCRASACSCRPAPRPARTRACSGSPCPSSTSTCAPAAWSAPSSAPTPPSPTPCTRSTTCCSPAIKELDVAEPQREALRAQVYALAERVREAYRQDKAAARLPRGGGRGRRDPRRRPAHAAAQPRTPSSPTLATYPVARTRPFFDSMENDVPGTGALFAATIDPWKCTGCLECIEVCGPGALTPLDQDADVLETLQERFEFMTDAAEHPQAVLSRARPGPTATSSGCCSTTPTSTRPPAATAAAAAAARSPRSGWSWRPATRSATSAAGRTCASWRRCVARLQDKLDGARRGRRRAARADRRRSSRRWRRGSTCTRAVPPATARRPR